METQETRFERLLTEMSRTRDPARHDLMDAFWAGMEAGVTLGTDERQRSNLLRSVGAMREIVEMARREDEQLRANAAPQAQTSGVEGGRDLDDTHNTAVGTEGERPSTDGREDQSGRGTAQGGAETRAVTSHLEELREGGLFRAVSSIISPLEGREGVKRGYVACLRAVADRVESQQDSPLPVLLAAGLPFYPTRDGQEVVVYAFATAEDYEKSTPFLWHRSEWR